MGGKNKKLKNECTDIRVGGGVSIALLGCLLSEELFRPTTRFKGEVLPGPVIVFLKTIDY